MLNNNHFEETGQTNELQQEFEGLKVFKKCDVKFALTLNIFEVDDVTIKKHAAPARMFGSRYNHKPSFEMELYSSNDQINVPLSMFQLMKIYQNKYQDLCNVIKYQNKVYFFYNKYYLRVFNTDLKSFMKQEYKFFDDPIPSAF